MDVAIPGDNRIQQKEVEKITKYQDLKMKWSDFGKKSNSSAGGDRSPRELFQKTSKNCWKPWDLTRNH